MGNQGARTSNTYTAADVQKNSSINKYFWDVFDMNGVLIAAESLHSNNPDENFIILKTINFIPNSYIKLADFALENLAKTQLVAKIFTYYYTTTLILGMNNEDYNKFIDEKTKIKIIREFSMDK